MEDFVFPERYIGVDVPAKEGGRVQMSERYKQLFDVTPGGTNLHIGKIFYEPQTDCSGVQIDVYACQANIDRA